MTKRIRRGGALAVSLMFLMLAALPKVACGADVIDLSADCSIEFHLENLVAVKGEAGDTEFSDLRDGSGVTVSVNLYKVADVTAGGRYEVTEAYRTEDEEKAEILQSELDKVSMHTTQADWETMAGYAETLAGVDLENEVFPQTDLQVQTDENGIGRIDQDDGLSSGLYFAAAEPAESAEYKYYFQSYLIALPDNQYYKTGSVGLSSGGGTEGSLGTALRETGNKKAVKIIQPDSGRGDFCLSGHSKETGWYGGIQ